MKCLNIFNKFNKVISFVLFASILVSVFSPSFVFAAGDEQNGQVSQQGEKKQVEEKKIDNNQLNNQINGKVNDTDKNGQEKGNKIKSIASIVVPILAGISLLGCIFAPKITKSVFAPKKKSFMSNPSVGFMGKCFIGGAAALTGACAVIALFWKFFGKKAVDNVVKDSINGAKDNLTPNWVKAVSSWFGGKKEESKPSVEKKNWVQGFLGWFGGGKKEESKPNVDKQKVEQPKKEVTSQVNEQVKNTEKPEVLTKKEGEEETGFFGAFFPKIVNKTEEKKDEEVKNPVKKDEESKQSVSKPGLFGKVLAFVGLGAKKSANANKDEKKPEDIKQKQNLGENVQSSNNTPQDNAPRVDKEVDKDKNEKDKNEQVLEVKSEVKKEEIKIENKSPENVGQNNGGNQNMQNQEVIAIIEEKLSKKSENNEDKKDNPAEKKEEKKEEPTSLDDINFLQVKNTIKNNEKNVQEKKIEVLVEKPKENEKIDWSKVDEFNPNDFVDQENNKNNEVRDIKKNEDKNKSEENTNKAFALFKPMKKYEERAKNRIEKEVFEKKKNDKKSRFNHEKKVKELRSRQMESVFERNIIGDAFLEEEIKDSLANSNSFRDVLASAEKEELFNFAKKDLLDSAMDRFEKQSSEKLNLKQNKNDGIKEKNEEIKKEEKKQGFFSLGWGKLKSLFIGKAEEAKEAPEQEEIMYY